MDKVCEENIKLGAEPRRGNTMYRLSTFAQGSPMALPMQLRIATLLLLVGAIATPAMIQAQAGAKEVVAVLDLEALEATKVQAAAFTDRVREELVASGRYTVVDRNQLNSVLDEQALQQTGCTSQECAVKVGRILGVRKLISGRLTKIDGGLWQVSATLLDVETAATLKAVSVQHEGPYRTLLIGGAGSLVAKLLDAGAASPGATGTPSVGKEPAGWKERALMPTPRAGAAAGLIGGQIYVAAGGTEKERLDTLEVYNPRNDVWGPKAPMPTSRAWVAGAVVRDALYVLGGYRLNWDNVTDRVDIYTPASGKWTQGPDMPTSRALLAAVSLGDQIYAIGGMALGRKALATVEAYQPATRKWTTLAPMSIPRLAPAAAALNGKIYVFGGRQTWSGVRETSMEIYDVAANRWSPGKKLPQQSSHGAAFVLGNQIHLVGGMGNKGGVVNVAHIYDPAKDTWRKSPELPVPRYGAVSVIVEGSAYVIGGADEAKKDPVASVYAFQP